MGKRNEIFGKSIESDKQTVFDEYDNTPHCII